MLVPICVQSMGYHDPIPGMTCTKAAAAQEPPLILIQSLALVSALQLPLMVQANEVPDLILTSAALDDQWSHSIFALIPSWTRKILFKRDSSVNHQLVSKKMVC